MPTSVEVKEFFEEEYKKLGINIFYGGRDVVEIETLTTEEEDAIDLVVKSTKDLLAKKAPSLAEDWWNHKSFFLKSAQIAKAHIPSVGTKPIRFPAETGTLGVGALIPYAIKYTTTPTATAPAYTSYKNNLWEIDLTAGTSAYIFGDGTNFYKASPTDNKRAMLSIIQNGLIEVSTTPRLYQQKVRTEILTKYGAFPCIPLVEIPTEVEHKIIYQYNTIGAMNVFHDLGIMWEVKPHYAGTSVIYLLGLFFYEYEFYKDTEWL